jgi:hypothetical protein
MVKNDWVALEWNTAMIPFDMHFTPKIIYDVALLKKKTHYKSACLGPTCSATGSASNRHSGREFSGTNASHRTISHNGSIWLLPPMRRVMQ